MGTNGYADYGAQYGRRRAVRKSPAVGSAHCYLHSKVCSDGGLQCRLWYGCRMGCLAQSITRHALTPRLQ